MADPVTIVGTIASAAQIVGVIISSCDTLSRFSRDFQDAPAEVQRLHEKLDTTRISLQSMQLFIEDMSEDEVLPLDLRRMLSKIMSQVQRSTADLKQSHDRLAPHSTKRLGRRFRWALLDKHLTQKLTQQLQDCESGLSNVLQQLIL
jgi:hypothetical protein